MAVTFISDYPAKMRIDDIAQKTRNEIVPVKFDEDGRLTTAVKTALNAGRGNPRPALFTPLVPAGRQGIFEFLAVVCE